MNSNIKLPLDIDWQTRFYYSGPRVTAQSKSKGIFSMSSAINKDILNNKGTISFRASDIFNTSKRISKTITPTFISYGEFQWRQPTYVLTFTYKINESKALKKRRSSRNNSGGGGDEFDF